MWIVDGYIMLDNYLYFEFILLFLVIVDFNEVVFNWLVLDKKVFYICNLVKVIVDVYDGMVMLY